MSSYCVSCSDLNTENAKVIKTQDLVSRAFRILVERNLEQYVVVSAVLTASSACEVLWEYIGKKHNLN